MAATVRFGLLVAMFQAMSGDKGSAKKRGRLRVFLDRAYVPSGGRDDFFSALRLVLPGLDRERGTYGLKEAALATVLVDALGIAKDSPDAVRLINWRRGGGGRNAGNFALVAAEVLQRRQGITSGGLTIKEVNDALDRLAATENRSEKASILSTLIKKTNALEMKWLLMIILKELKLGISEKSIFDEFHPDAQDLFNVTCDLKFVCEKLNDRSQRHKRQDIELGKAVRPQLAMRVRDASAAWKKFHGKKVVAECKFDGDRIQIHKNGEEIHFFSRSFLDHSEYAPGMSKLIKENILVDRCILDGEMLVWDTVLNRFAEFGSNQEIAKAAREGLETDRQQCIDVAFDILYAGDTSVIHQSLTERHEILQKVVKPLKGQLEILIPTGGLNVRRPSDEPCWSIIAHNLEDVEKFFKDTIENRDEGIILKDLDSKWEPGDRNGKWLKLKPDYIHAGADLDVIIIGGYYGSGRRGGEVAQFLVGLAVPSDDNSYPKRFLSFCRVGTGLSDEECDVLVTKLKPYFRKNEYPKKTPKFYEVTNNSKERPDVWIASPDKSVILSITSDIRTIKSEVFAAPYCLRFPRIQRVRYDKPWHECLDVQAFVDIVHSSNGTTQRAADDNSLKNDNIKPSRTNKKGEKKKSVSIIPSHLMKTDVSDFVNIPSSYNLEYFHKLVVENGGSFSMNLNDSVTHCIAAEKKGIKYQAAIRQGRIIHYDWILDCCKEKRPLHLQPKHKFSEEIDSYADYYYWDIDIADLKQYALGRLAMEKMLSVLEIFMFFFFAFYKHRFTMNTPLPSSPQFFNHQIFSNIDKVAGDSNMVNQYKSKHCIDERFCFFQGCCVYLHNAPLVNADYNVISDLALKRVKQDLTMHGGQVCSSIAPATHLVVVSVLQNYNFDLLYKSFPPAERCYLHDKRLHVVSNKWLEDSVEKQMKLSETAYNLKPDTLEELEIERSEENVCPLDHKFEEHKEVERTHVKYAPRKRSRPASNSRTAKAVPRPVRRTRARRGNQQAKIDDDVESEESVPGECQDDQNMDTDYISNEIGKDSRNKEQGPPRAASRPVPRTRARRGNQHAKIDDGESEESGPCETGKEDQKLDLDYTSKTEGDNSGKDHGPPPGAQFVTLGEQEPKCVESNAMEEKPGSPFQRTGAAEVTSSVPVEKIEQMVDPLHAMLLDMIPSLSQTRTEHASRVPSTKVDKDPPRVGSYTSHSDIPVPDAGTSGVPAPDPNAAPPPKKKKVSYKDVAGELLKDW
ncbi:putative DNA ligase 4 [Dichanthelium oligosanthes]|uniref:DNA ligase n=1 Tax=Dichanthelium oligosanthes TaxID=888268 RepID=A0A1E5VTF6_9POAL|nr:putative DNA ligase 4 [Dichanthelium oligosanthes]